MYIVNITFKVPHELYDEWLTWMQSTWRSYIVESSEKTVHQLHRLLGHDDEHGITMVFQLHFASRALLDNYLGNREAAIHQSLRDKWGESVLFFQTVLERVIE